MKVQPAPPGAEALLEHAEFLRRLSRSLLRDEAAAEDNVQQTWLAALENPPKHGHNVKAWLGSIARNVARRQWRGDERRGRRERRASRSNPSPAPDDVLAQLETQRRVVDAVAALDEPYRSTVVHRFFHGMKVSEIARDQRVPVETVKTRLKRALKQLRARLDRDHGGDRAAWALALLPLALPIREAMTAGAAASTSLAAAGGTVMKVKMVLTAAILLAVGGTAFFAWKSARGTESVAPRRETEPIEETARPVLPGSDVEEKGARRRGDEREAEESSVRRPDETRRERPEVPAKMRPVGPGWLPLPVGVVAGTLALSGGGPPEGARVKISGRTAGADGENWSKETGIDGAGEFRFDEVPPGSYELEATHPDFAHTRIPFAVGAERGNEPFELLLKKGGGVLVVVTDAYHQPVADTRIVVEEDVSFTPAPVVFEGLTDGEGKLLVERLPPASYVVRRPVVAELAAEDPKTGKTFKRLVEQGPKRHVTVIPDRIVDVVFSMSCSVRGVVIGPDGSPLAGAKVRFLPVVMGKNYRAISATTDKDGGYAQEGFGPGEYEVTVQALGKEFYVVPVGRVAFPAGQVLDHPIRIESTFVEGRLTRADTGRPLTRPDVQITATPVEAGEDGEYRKTGAGAMTWADDDGRYRFVGLKEGSYRIWIAPLRDKTLVQAFRVVQIRPGGRPVEADFALEVRTLGTLRLKVLEPDGTPASGVTFGLITKETDESISTQSLRPANQDRGVFTFRLQEGMRKVTVWRRGFDADRIVVEIKPGETLTREVKLRRAQ